MKKTHIYQAYSRREYDYNIITLEVYPTDCGTFFTDPDIVVTWQQTPGDDHVYGGELKLKAGSDTALENRLKTARKFSKVHFWDLTEEVLNYLDKWATPAVYDSRVHKLVTAAELLPPTLRRYVDDYENCNRIGCTYSALAETPEAARQDILQQAGRDNAHRFIGQWASCEMPVKLTNELPPAAPRSLREVVAAL